MWRPAGRSVGWVVAAAFCSQLPLTNLRRFSRTDHCVSDGLQLRTAERRPTAAAAATSPHTTDTAPTCRVDDRASRQAVRPRGGRASGRRGARASRQASKQARKQVGSHRAVDHELLHSTMKLMFTRMEPHGHRSCPSGEGSACFSSWIVCPGVCPYLRLSIRLSVYLPIGVLLGSSPRESFR